MIGTQEIDLGQSMFQLQTIAELLHAACTENAPIESITIDSRKVKAGSLFIAIQGEHFDGHDFAHEAQAKGAAAIICDRPIDDLAIPQLIVNDPVLALGKIAKFHRQQFSIPTIALTGSNGKTSVKEMIYAILPRPSLCNSGNLNNHLGAPLSILQLNATHLAAVFELGANHVGEIAYTADLVHPDVALINNIAPAHIGEFGSIEAIAQAKGEIFGALAPHGTAVINDDDAFAHFWDEQLAAHPVLKFSKEHPADVFARKISLNAQGFATFDLHLPNATPKQITLAVPGLHNVSNALAAATCCHAINMTPEQIVHGLSQFSGVPGRLTFRKGMENAIIIDDTYNANLRSVLAAIEVLAKQPGQKILVLGNMGELGELTIPHHEEAGKAAKKSNIDALYTYGQFAQASSDAFGKGALHFSTQPELIAMLKPQLNAKTTVLIKGSRSAAMEHIVAALIQQT
jgi:UDP-N-acetylmuramoyl-tripeptide--D-alanyl-D-alanine ligase